jgi:hypothetical protein
MATQTSPLVATSSSSTRWVKPLRFTALVSTIQDGIFTPTHPQKKGIVESGAKYVKGNFLALRKFRNLADLNEQTRAWVTQVAGQRTHGTTRQAPLALFEVERPCASARPLPRFAPGA